MTGSRMVGIGIRPIKKTDEIVVRTDIKSSISKAERLAAEGLIFIPKKQNFK